MGTKRKAHTCYANRDGFTGREKFHRDMAKAILIRADKETVDDVRLETKTRGSQTWKTRAPAHRRCSPACPLASPVAAAFRRTPQARARTSALEWATARRAPFAPS